MRISAYIILYHDLQFLDDILRLVDPYLEEIVIVDGPYEYCVETLQDYNLFYTEETKPDELQKILQKYRAKIRYFYRVWRDEKEKRIFGYEQCSHNQVLLVDCDEFFVFDSRRLMSWLRSRYAVGGFLIHNMNRIDVCFDPPATKNILFKKNKISAGQHLSYTWLVGVEGLEPQETALIDVGGHLGTIYHMTLNRNRFNGVVKYIFYLCLYYHTRSLPCRLLPYRVETLQQWMTLDEIQDVFYHSRLELLGIPLAKILTKIPHVPIDLSRYSHNHNYLSESTFRMIRDVEHYTYITTPDNPFWIRTENIRRLSVRIYEIVIGEPYETQEYETEVISEETSVSYRTSRSVDETLARVLCLRCTETIDAANVSCGFYPTNKILAF